MVRSSFEGDSTIALPWNLNRYKRFPDHCGGRTRFAENYPPPAHNASWRFEMGRIAGTANGSNEARSERQIRKAPPTPISAKLRNAVAAFACGALHSGGVGFGSIAG
jgi:hypothetical protein